MADNEERDLYNASERHRQIMDEADAIYRNLIRGIAGLVIFICVILGYIIFRK